MKFGIRVEYLVGHKKLLVGFGIRPRLGDFIDLGTRRPQKIIEGPMARGPCPALPPLSQK